MKNKELNLFNRLFKIVLTISFLFCVSCSSKKYKVADFCEDVFIPGNKYYETNVKHQEGFEIPPVLKAKDILPPSMLGNKLYTIKDEVYSDGTIDHFYLKSKWGDSKAESFLILKTRINEVNALESLDKLERVPFFKGLGKSALAVITSPWKLVKLIGKMFTASPKETTEEDSEDEEKLKEIKKQTVAQNNGNDNDDDDSELVNKRFGKILDDDKDFVEHIPYNKFNSDETANVNTVQSLIGVRENIIDILEKFHIDPDNTNPVLRDKILHISKMKAYGGLTTSLVPATQVLTILNTTKTFVDAADTISVYSTEREQMEKIHDGLLLAGCSKKLIDKFEKADGFSTFLKVIIANNVIRLRKVKNVNELIKIAVMVDDYEIGWMMMQGFAILPTLYEKEPFVRFIKDAPLATVVTKDNRVLITFAGDHLYWVRDTSMFFKETLEAIKEDGIKPKEIVAMIKGVLSERFKNELKNLGIKYVPVDSVEYSIKIYNEDF